MMWGAPTNFNEAQVLRCIRFCDISSSCTLIYKVECRRRRSLIFRYLFRVVIVSGLDLGERRPFDIDMMENSRVTAFPSSELLFG